MDILLYCQNCIFLSGKFAIPKMFSLQLLASSACRVIWHWYLDFYHNLHRWDANKQEFEFHERVDDSVKRTYSVWGGWMVDGETQIGMGRDGQRKPNNCSTWLGGGGGSPCSPTVAAKQRRRRATAGGGRLCLDDDARPDGRAAESGRRTENWRIADTRHNTQYRRNTPLMSACAFTGGASEPVRRARE